MYLNLPYSAVVTQLVLWATPPFSTPHAIALGAVDCIRLIRALHDRITMKIRLEFGGGLHLLAGDVKVRDLDLPPREGTDSQWRMKELLPWIRDNIILVKHELFMRDESLRPGILALINDVDWEICGGAEAPVTDGDDVVFVSTLHGG